MIVNTHNSVKKLLVNRRTRKNHVNNTGPKIWGNVIKKYSLVMF